MGSPLKMLMILSVDMSYWKEKTEVNYSNLYSKWKTTSLADIRMLKESLQFNGSILTTVSNIQKIKDFITVFIPIVALVPSFLQMVLSLK